jgi:tubulin polyglutamylase TTLL6/13
MMELPKRITINLSESKYSIIHNAAKSLGWRVTTNPEEKNSEVWWSDGGVSPEKLASLKLFQKINHFPGMVAVSRKDNLARNLGRMSAVFPEDFKFSPRTWILPADSANIRTQCKNLKTALIVKPKASSQGKGIYLVRGPDDIETGK